jgi:hypothetical protein
MRAAQLKAPPPPQPVADERDAPAVDDYLGTYTNAAGRRLEVIAAAGQLMLVDGSRRIPLESYGDDLFEAPDPAFAPHTLVFERAPMPASESPAQHATGNTEPPPPVEILGHGDQSYFHTRFAGSREDTTTAELRQLQGTYRCDDPWIGTTRIVARRGSLWMQTSWGGPVSLVADGPNTYRIYAMEVPDVVRFDAFVDGQPQVLWTCGVPVARASV